MVRVQLIHQYCGFIRTSLLQLRPDGSIYVNLAVITQSHLCCYAFCLSFFSPLLSYWPVWIGWKATLCVPVWTTGAAVTPPRSFSQSVSSNRSAPPRSAGHQGCLGAAVARLWTDPGGCTSSSELWGLRRPRTTGWGIEINTPDGYVNTFNGGRKTILSFHVRNRKHKS